MSEREELEAVIDGLRAAQKRLYDDAEPHEGGRPFGAMVRGADAMGEAARKLKALSDSEGVAPSGGDAGLVEGLKAALEACSIYSGSCGDVIYGYGYDGPTVDQLLDKARAALPTPPAQDTQRAERATNGGRDDG